MIKVHSKGDYGKLSSYLERLKGLAKVSILDRYGQEGVAALESATPIDSGITAGSWSYNIERSSGGAILSFENSSQNDGVYIAIILQFGHGTGTGGWVEGRDYINPAIQPIFDKIADEAWREVTSA